jgi:HAE1 family hydrophobic/amphiphilic exporter-1
MAVQTIRLVTRAALAAAVLIGLAAPAKAGPLVLTLDEAVRMAGEQSTGVKKAREARNEYEGRYRKERAAAFPKFTAQGVYSRSEDDSKADMGDPGSTTSAVAGITLTQPLFTWGRLSAAIRAAGLGLDLWQDELAQARATSVRDVTVAFADVLLARELEAIARQTLEQRQRHLEETGRRLTAGTATDYDVLAARVAADNARPEAIRSANAVRAARHRLAFLLGLDGREVDASGSLEVSDAGDLPTYEAALAQALARRPELAGLRRAIAMGEEVVRIQAAGNKPTLALQGETAWKDIDVGVAAGDGAYWSAGLVVSWPIFDGGLTAGATAMARSDVAALRLDQENLSRGVALEVRQGLDAVDEARQRVDALKGTMDQATRLLEMAEKGYALGVKIPLEVSDAALNLAAARASLALARRDLMAARAGLDRALGR